MEVVNHILLLDDDATHLEMCTDILGSAGYRCTSMTDPDAALDFLSAQVPDAVLVDLRMPKLNGIDFLKKVTQSHPVLPVIMLTAFATIEKTVEAIQCGAFDFIEKPIKTDNLLQSISRAVNRKRSKDAELTLLDRPKKQVGLYNLIGNSQPMGDVYNQIRNVAPYDLNVFIYGESGTGKELTADAICKLSKRAKHPFIPIDCAAISESLIDSELFGHEQGAFTGATSKKVGLLETANGGTVFLDELTELKPGLQSKFLRVLEQGQFRRVQGTSLINLDVRVFAASNRNPWQAIKENRLREDLFYRLNGVTINLPPLRDREGDLELLSSYFLKQTALTTGESSKTIDSKAMTILKQYRWPGNVRELYKLIEQLHVMSADAVISTSDLPPYIRNHCESTEEMMDLNLPYKKAEEKWLGQFKDTYFNHLLKKHNGNISKAARDAGLDRTTIYRWMKGND